MPHTAILTFKQLGDTLLMEPALRHLSRANGETATLFAKPAFAPLVELMPNARLPERGRRYSQLWVLERGTKAARRAFWIRAREKRLFLLRRKYLEWYHHYVFDSIEHGPRKGYEYRALFNYRAVGGDESEFRPPRLAAPPPDWAPTVGLPDRYLVICPTAAWESKLWTDERWARTLDGIASRCGLPLAMVGGPAEWERRHAAAIVSRTGAPVVDLVGKTSLKELLSLVSRASAAVCIDGAVAHLAAAFDVPALTLFGPTRTVEWHWPTDRSVALEASDYCDEKSPSLAHLPPEPVVEQALRLVGMRKER